MPTCPGCQQRVSYGRLKPHVRLCKWVWSEAPSQEGNWETHIARELDEIERQLGGTSSLRELEREVQTLRSELSRTDETS